MMLENLAGHAARFSDTPNIILQGEDQKDQFDAFLFHQISGKVAVVIII